MVTKKFLPLVSTQCRKLLELLLWCSLDQHKHHHGEEIQQDRLMNQDRMLIYMLLV